MLRSSFYALILSVLTVLASALPAAAQVSAERVQSVYWGQSFLSHAGQGLWEERSASGAQLDFTFVEVYRDDRAIILNDESRGVDLRIDMARMMIDYADANNPDYRPLYKLAGYIDRDGVQHPAVASVPDGPDLSVTWQSDFGPIHWSENYYDVPSKVLKGTLRSHGGVEYVYEGFWARTDSDRRGAVLFIFSPDGQSFKGTYVASDGTKKPWNGYR